MPDGAMRRVHVPDRARRGRARPQPRARRRRDRGRLDARLLRAARERCAARGVSRLSRGAPAARAAT
ncbi:hypothetical protein F01_460079 [Burkholderia cenocepacia]|nr:hypothetical protein F01_460079 [Burkholderia cenocepacia]